MQPTRKEQDPAGTKKLRDASIREVRKRMRLAAKLIRERVKQWPHTIEQVPDDEAPKVPKSAKRDATLKTSNAQKYAWLVSDPLMDQTMAYIQSILADALLSGDDSWTRRWWMNAYVDPASEMGTAQAIVDAQSVISATGEEETARIASIITAEQVLQSPPYQRRLKLMHGRVFENMKGVHGDTVSDLRRVLTDGVARGLGIRDLTGQINDRIGVGLSRAERIARTEINKALTDSYMAETDDFNQVLEDEGDPWVLREMHRSALSPTTRKSHAARHGKIYTHAEQTNWWDSGSNRISCLCSISTVMVNRKTGEIHPSQKKLVERTRERGEQYFKAEGIEA